MDFKLTGHKHRKGGRPGMWYLPIAGIEPLCPELAGRFFTAKPRGSFITQGLCSAKLKIFLLLSFLEQCWVRRVDPHLSFAVSWLVSPEAGRWSRHHPSGWAHLHTGSPLPASSKAGLSTLRLQSAPALLPSGPASLCHMWEPSSDHHTPASLRNVDKDLSALFPMVVCSLKLQSGPSA